MQNKYKLHENGLAAVEAIKGPVAVVSVAGLYRTGKSYLLNRLLDRQSGFDVGPTINPCTKGIYVWGAPIKSPTMGDVNIILIDTEGLGSFDASATHDVKIFSLAILLSSYFIYNSMGTIDENALDKLSLVTHLTEHIQLRTAGKGSKEAEANIFAKYFPRFLWVVRDFSLQLKDESNNTISETEYLERALSEKHGSRSEEKNAIRKAIKKFFPNRDCVTLVRPVESEQKLQSIDKTPYKELRDEFKKKMDSLRNKILNEVEPKRDGSSGAVISGAAWAALVRKYVEALNKGAVPNISDSWASVVLKEGQRAVDEAVAALVAALPKDVAREEEWEQAKLRARAAALDAFRATAIGNEEDVAPHRQAFEQRAEKELKEAETRIRGNARAVAQAALDMAFAAWMEKVRAGVIKDPTAVPGEWDTVARKAIAGLKGLVTEHKAVLSDFTHNKLPLAMAAVHNQVQQAHMKRQEELMAQISAKEKALTEEAKKGAEEARKAADESRKAAAAEAKLEIEKERAARSGEDNKRLNEEVKELKEARKRLETEKTLLTQKVSQLAAELEALKAERDAARAAANEHQTTSARSQHELRTELHALQAKLKERDAEATRRAKEVAEKDKAIDLLGATKTGLEAEIAALSAKSAEAGAAAQRAKQKDEQLATQERRITALETELAAARALLASAASVPHPPAAAAAAAAPMLNALPVVAVSEADEGEDESEAKKPGKRGRSPAAGAAKRSKNAKGEKATPAAGDNAEEVYSGLTVPQLKAVLIDANVRPPVGKVTKADLVALCVENDAKCRAHVKN